jgi:pimeloyl-ACP methyl ester carboxylesterase
MRKRRIAVIAMVVAVALACVAGVFLIPRELKNAWRFESWRKTHVRTAGFVERAPTGTRISWEEFGNPSGPPVVVLHAGFGTTTVMVGQIEQLAAASMRVIAIDSRGQGKSTDTALEMTYEMMSDDVIAVMDALRIERAAVVGWSDGGNIGLDLARRYGGRITKVVAFGANHSPDGIAASEVQQFKDLKADSPLVWPLRHLYEKSSPTPEKWAELFEKQKRLLLSQPNWSFDELHAVAAPVLLVNGEHDVVSLAHAMEMKNAIPGARLEIIPGEDHMVPLANPEVLKPLMLAFLSAS